MKAFAIELQNEVVERLMKLWKVKTTAEIRDILQGILDAIIKEHITELTCKEIE